MLVQLIIGSAAILASMGVLVGFVSVAMRMLPAANSVLTNLNYPLIRLFILLSSAVILILAASTVCVWLWAILFQVLGVFDTLEEAIYFALVSISTVGYGDVVVGKEWRVLSGFVAVNGLLAFGIFTAFLIELMREASKQFIKSNTPDDD